MTCLPFLSPRTVPAPPRPGLLSAGLVFLCVSRVGGDERCVLDDALLDAEALLVQLPLQLLPDSPVPAGFGEALPEKPDRRGVRYSIGKPEEASEADAVVRLAFQLGIREAVPALEDQHLHHHDGVDVWSASLGALVVVEGLDDWGEGLPVYEGLYLG